MRNILQTNFVANIQTYIKNWTRHHFEQQTISSNKQDLVQSQPDAVDDQILMNTLEGEELIAASSEVKVITREKVSPELMKTVEKDTIPRAEVNGTSTALLKQNSKNQSSVMEGSAPAEFTTEVKKVELNEQPKSLSKEEGIQTNPYLLTDEDLPRGDSAQEPGDVSLTNVFAYKNRGGTKSSVGSHSADFDRALAMAATTSLNRLRSNDSAKLDASRVDTAYRSSQKGFDNEIIMKVEMKKFMHLIDSKNNRRNNLVTSDKYRLYPLNQIANGNARPVTPPIVFDESDSYLKFHPKLFALQKKLDKSRIQITDEDNGKHKILRPSLAHLLKKKRGDNVTGSPKPTTSFDARAQIDSIHMSKIEAPPKTPMANQTSLM